MLKVILYPVGKCLDALGRNNNSSTLALDFITAGRWVMTLWGNCKAKGKAKIHLREQHFGPVCSICVVSTKTLILLIEKVNTVVQNLLSVSLNVF